MSELEEIEMEKPKLTWNRIWWKIRRTTRRGSTSTSTVKEGLEKTWNCC